MQYTWLLFDADGTLFDYRAAEDNALKQNFAVHGLVFRPAHQQRYQVINHDFWQRFERKEVTPEDLRVGRFRQLFTETGIDFDADAFADTYLEQLAQQAQLLDGAAELLAELHGRYNLALITNGLADVQYPRLQQSGLQDYFRAVVVSDEVGAAKPDAAIFDAVFARMGRPAKSEVLIIGDSLSSDMQGGVNYGIDTCWFNENGRFSRNGLPIRYEIHQLADLRAILSDSWHEQ